MTILVLGYGNPSRQDDALGPSLADAIAELKLDGVATDSDYQLNIEYALDIAPYDLVIFADASVEAKEPFAFTKLEASREITFTTHSVSAESVLGLCEDIGVQMPEAWQMAIRGYSFDFGDGLTEKASENLEEAVKFVAEFIGERS
jgi:hydrogenase maturation protease